MDAVVHALRAMLREPDLVVPGLGLRNGELVCRVRDDVLLTIEYIIHGYRMQKNLLPEEVLSRLKALGAHFLIQCNGVVVRLDALVVEASPEVDALATSLFADWDAKMDALVHELLQH